MLNLEELIDPGFLKSEGLMDPPTPTLDTILAVEELTDTISGYEDSKRELVQLDRKFDEVDEQATKLEIIQDTVAKFGFTRSTYRLALWNPFVARQSAMFPGVEDISLADRPDSIQASAAMESLAQVITTVWDFIRQILLQLKHALTKFFHFWSLRVLFYRTRLKKIRDQAKDLTVLNAVGGVSINVLNPAYSNDYANKVNQGTPPKGDVTLFDELEASSATAKGNHKVVRPGTHTDSTAENIKIAQVIGAAANELALAIRNVPTTWLPTISIIEQGDPNNLCEKAKFRVQRLRERLDDAWEHRPERTEFDITHTSNFMSFNRAIRSHQNLPLYLCDLAERMLELHRATGNNSFAIPAFNNSAKLVDIFLAASRKYQFKEISSDHNNQLAKKFREAAEVYRILASCFTTFADHHLWWVKETLHAASVTLELYRKSDGTEIGYKPNT
jgi:hypothetical protein